MFTNRADQRIIIM